MLIIEFNLLVLLVHVHLCDRKSICDDAATDSVNVLMILVIPALLEQFFEHFPKPDEIFLD